jgi:hypothetical protein
MSGTLGKMAPTAIVLVLAAWCCWPYLEGPRSAGGVQQGDELPRITASLLSPDVKPAPERDPFQPFHASKADSPEGKEPRAPLPGQKKAIAEKDDADIFSGLVLGAIYIQGDRRMALINGQVCRQGDPLAISASTTEPCIVAEISSDKVLLLYRGQTVELRYEGLAFSADPTEGRSN